MAVGNDGLGGSGVGLSDVLTTLKNGVIALGNLAQILAKGNLAQTGTTPTATAGTGGAPPAQVAGYFTVVNPATGVTQKVPFYD